MPIRMTADKRLTTEFLYLKSVLRRPSSDGTMRKTSLLLETDPTVSGQAPPTWVCTPAVGFPTKGVRIDLLFTMSDNTTPSGHAT
jgi:hypothetical protein